ncbi:hypothetical protein HDU78_011237 [Chytriomyces hyalinus]|nr:hypothetical protein HDU78_011237 [Chytriomyces hyalinus]
MRKRRQIEKVNAGTSNLSPSPLQERNAASALATLARVGNESSTMEMQENEPPRENPDEITFFDAEETPDHAGNGENMAPMSTPAGPQTPPRSSIELKQELLLRKQEEKERKAQEKEEDKLRKAEEKAREKEEKEREKARDKEEKAREKAREKEEKEREKAREKEEKEREKEREKEQKAQEKRDAAEAENKRINWKEDGSLDVLIDWLSDFENYNRWKGGFSQTGQTKEVISDEIAEFIASRGIRGRTGPAVKAKVSQLESDYRNACDWRAGTGNGIMEDITLDPQTRVTQVEAHVRKLCPHYDLVHPVLMDRPSSRPLLTSDDPLDPFPSIATPDQSSSSEARSPLRPSIPTIASPRSAKKVKHMAKYLALDSDRASALKAQQIVEQERLALEKQRASREEARNSREEELHTVQMEKAKLEVILGHVKARLELKPVVSKSRLDSIFPDLVSDDEN